MTSSPLSDELALRIGLAARELPDTDAALMLRVLADSIGLPPSAASLARLKVKDLKQAADGALADVDTASLKRALACLQGEVAAVEDELPECQPYADGDMPGSIRVACASNWGGELDGHFGSCRRFLIFQVSATQQRLLAVREVGEVPAGQDKNGYRASLIGDCQILFVQSIGGPAAAKVVRRGVHPIKHSDAGAAVEQITDLQKVIGNGAPPWLAKIMGQSPHQRVRFATTSEGLEAST